MLNKKGYIASLVFLILFIGIFFLRKHQSANIAEYQHNEGRVFGTLYHITYESPEDLHDQIREEFNKFNMSLSIFEPNSVISRVNQNDTSVVLDKWFLTVYNKGKEISEITEGSFDITVGPLANAWGFGFNEKIAVTPGMVDSLRQFVGNEKIKLVDGKMVKSDLRVTLNASAIAKGYACDVIAELLQSKGISNYMVEIGGELNVMGRNKKGNCWRIGINKPIEDQSGDTGEIQDVINICDGGMATSGNYRNFYYKDGKRYAHTIDPRTGYPVEHSLLSATVITTDCISADAYATAFMVLGLEKSLQITESIPCMEAYFICSDGNEGFKVVSSSGFSQYTGGN